MVKVGFLKTIKNNMSLKKSFIILGLLVILSIVLFSSYNEYSLENFKPKPNVEMEIYLWTGPYISGENDLASRWIEFTNNYGNIPNITLGRGKAKDFTKYLELDKNPHLNLDTNEHLKPLKSVDLTKETKLVPFVSVFFVTTIEGKVRKDSFGLLTGKDVTYDNLSKTINSLVNMFYDGLYESDFNPNAPVVPAAPVAPAATPASNASASTASTSKLPWNN